MHLETHLKMIQLLRENFDDYMREHPNEYVLIEKGKDFQLKTSFYKTKEEKDEALKKYRGLMGTTFLTELIPEKSHRYNEGNEHIVFIDDYVECCPNDNETVLKGGPVKGMKDDYQEICKCPDCGCTVYRKPSDELIKKIKGLEKLRVG